jgi:hypothetical protein
MSDIIRPEGGTPPSYNLPQFPKSWGPYLAYNAAICLAAFGAVTMAHSDIVAIVIGCTAISAVVAGLIVRLRNAD